MEVPVSGMVVNFLTLRTLQRETQLTSPPGNWGFWDYCSNDIEDSLEENILGEIMNVYEFFFSMIKTSVQHFHLQAEMLPGGGALNLSV